MRGGGGGGRGEGGGERGEGGGGRESRGLHPSVRYRDGVSLSGDVPNKALVRPSCVASLAHAAESASVKCSKNAGVDSMHRASIGGIVVPLMLSNGLCAPESVGGPQRSASGALKHVCSTYAAFTTSVI